MISWIVYRQSKKSKESIPLWSGFTVMTTTSEPQHMTVSSLPIINASAYELDTILAVIERSQATTRCVDQKCSVISLDKQLHCMAKML